LFITGDTESHDKIAAHYLSRTNVIRPCRICDVPFEGLGDPREDSWLLTKQSDIEKLAERDDRDALKEMSQQPVKVAFHSGLIHGGQYGLNGNNLPGFLHIFAHGNFPRVKHGLFTSKKLNSNEVVLDSDGKEEPISAPSNGLSGNESEQKKPAAKSGANATHVTHPKKKKKSRKKKITSFAKVSTDDNNADSDAEFVYSTDAQKAT